MVLSLQRRRDANLVLTYLRTNIQEKKNIRRFLTLSISHCLLRRLRRCFNRFKLLLTPWFKMSAQDWYHKRLVASVFGRWLTFVHDQQHNDSKLMDKSTTHHKRKGIEVFALRSRRRQLICRQNSRGVHLGLTYHSFLRLLESFEMIYARKNTNLLSRAKMDHARHYMNIESKSRCLGKCLDHDVEFHRSLDSSDMIHLFFYYCMQYY